MPNISCSLFEDLFFGLNLVSYFYWPIVLKKTDQKLLILVFSFYNP